MNKSLFKVFSVITILALMLMALPMQNAQAAPPLFANPTTTVFINEIHYDNASTDVGEAIEVAGPAGTDLTGWSLVLYNGNGGAVYATLNLSGVIANQQGGYGTLSFAAVGLQNGSPDGIALVDASSSLVQFLSYEGTFTGVGGAANGFTSTDIGVTQNGTEPVGSSLQLTGTGDNYGDFTWTATTANTFGNLNTGQTFGSGDAAPSVSSTSPTNGASNVAINTNIDVTFSEDVNASGSWFDISCGTSGAHTATVSGGSTTFALDPDADFANGETCTVTVFAAQIADQDVNDPPDNMAADYLFSFDTVSAATADVLVINEIDYDQPGTDGAEFVEIRNNDIVSVDLSSYSIQLINGNGGAQYQLFALPAVNLAPGDYFVLCGNAGNTPNCDLDVTPNTDLVQNGAPDAVALLFGTSIVDTVSYEGNTIAPYTEGSGVGLEDPGTTGNINLGISRLPDGVDTDQNNIDFSTRCITPGEANSSSASSCVLDTPPTVASTNPTNGATNISVSNNIDINFSEAVTVSGNWFSISCANSGAHTAAVSGGPQNYTLDPDVNFAFSESCSVTLVAASVVDEDGTPNNMTTDYNFSFTTSTQPFVCGDPATFIHDIQGSGLASPFDGSVVTVEGVVVGSFQGVNQFSGFHIQEEDAEADADPATSEGIFIYNSANTPAVGDIVRIQGTVDEYNGLTELTSIANFLNCSSGNVVTPATVTLPVTSVNDFEKYEGMLVTFPQALVISEYFNYDRFGEIVLTSQRHLTPTAEFEPGSPEEMQAIQDFLLDKITLDDGRSAQNPDPAIHPNGNVFDLSNLFRGGDTVANVTGVMDYSFSLYRIQPTQGADYTSVNPRPAQPEVVGGNLKVVSMNTLNYFTTLTSSGSICGPLQNQDCRGADTPEEFARQRAKIIAAISTMNADVIGLLEIENNINDEAIQDLVDGLNAALGAGTYDYIHTGVIGGDAIKVALIYKPATVSLVGGYAILDSSVDPRFIDTRNRPALAQSFMDNTTGGIFTVAINHLKSKGSACAGDPDLGDGAGNCNITRTLAAQALVDWLAADPTGSGDTDSLIIGDLNSYDKEDPIDAIKAGPDDILGTADDYTDLVFQFQGEDAYSYVFDGQIGYLDYGLASASLTSQVTGVADWHVNADEPDLIDYDMSFKLPAQDTLYAPDPYRYSDHDPVIIGLNVCDEIAPTFDEVSVAPNQLWPANHKYVDITATVVVSDNFDPNPTVTLVSITSNEPDDGLGDGDTADDIVIVDDFHFKLRAERSGTGTGRIYTITYMVTDACGNSATMTVTVSVPHSKPK